MIDSIKGNGTSRGIAGLIDHPKAKQESSQAIRRVDATKRIVEALDGFGFSERKIIFQAAILLLSDPEKPESIQEEIDTLLGRARKRANEQKPVLMEKRGWKFWMRN